MIGSRAAAVALGAGGRAPDIAAVFEDFAAELRTLGKPLRLTVVQ